MRGAAVASVDAEYLGELRHDHRIYRPQPPGLPGSGNGFPALAGRDGRTTSLFLVIATGTRYLRAGLA